MPDKNFKILDCTLRDGGYYTNWNFSKKLVRELVYSLDTCNVNIIEMGYKSPTPAGRYKECNDKFIKSVINFNIKAQLCFMIDVKDYIQNNQVNISLLKKYISNSSESPFQICRVAAKYSEIKYIPEIVEFLISLGYKVACNLMSISLLDKKQIKEYTDITQNLNLLATYVADSYGSLYPKDVKEIFSNTQLNGVHTHDNMGLAFANCIEAINNGGTYIDGTITGMGRGSGNVTIEQLIAYNKNTHINSNLLNLQEKFLSLKAKYNWGINSFYHKAGQEHIHPLYIQNLIKISLKNSELLHILNNIPEKETYNDVVLKSLIENTIT